MPTPAQQFWDQLTPAERDRRIKYYDRTARNAFSHCCSILIGCPQKSTIQARSATGTLLLLKGHHYLLTANHVLEGFAKKLTHEWPVHFQIGDLVINPWSRVVYQSSEDDIVLLS